MTVKGLVLLVADQVLLMVLIADMQAVLVFGGGFLAIYGVDFFQKRKPNEGDESQRVNDNVPQEVAIRIDRVYCGVLYVICICDLQSPFPSHHEEVFWHGQLNSLALPICPPEEAAVRIKRHLEECVKAFSQNASGLSATFTVNPVDEFRPVQPLSEQ